MNHQITSVFKDTIKTNNMSTYNENVPEIKLRKKNGNSIEAKIKGPKDAERFFRSVFDNEELEVREQCMAVFLNQDHTTIGYFLVSVGGITATIVDQRLLFRAAIECGATSVILAHNHPSGSLVPSDHDLDLTKKLYNGGEILGIKLLDHIILTASEFFSMADENIMDQIKKS